MRAIDALTSALLVTALSSVMLSGCVSQTVSTTPPIVSGAEKRPPYELMIPLAAGKDAQTKRPLLVLMHGCLQSAEAIASSSGMNEEAERAGFFVMYPNQVHGRHPLNCWSWYDPASRAPNSGELKEILAMIDEVKAKHPIDERRIYVGGLSAGAGIAAALLACHPDRFAGGILHSGPAFGSASDSNEAQAVLNDGPIRVRTAAREKALEKPKEKCSPAGFKGRLLVINGNKDRTVHSRHADTLIEQFTTASERRERRSASWNLTYRGQYPARTVCYGKNSRVCRTQIDGLDHAWSGGELKAFSDPKGPSASEMARLFLMERKGPVVRIAKPSN